MKHKFPFMQYLSFSTQPNQLKIADFSVSGINLWVGVILMPGIKEYATIEIVLSIYWI